MTSRRSRLLVAVVVATISSCNPETPNGPSQLPIETPAVDTQPKEIAPDIVKAWEDAGAESGHTAFDNMQRPHFERGLPQNGQIPAFRFLRRDHGSSPTLGPLPNPGVPFGLDDHSGDFQIKALAGLKDLAWLDIYTHDDQLEQLPRLSNLECLHLSGVGISSTGLNTLATTQPQLKILVLRAKCVSLSEVSELAKMTNLEQLYLGNLIECEDLGPLYSLPKLHTLELDSLLNKILEHQLFGLSKAIHLRVLNLSYTETTNAVLERLAGLGELEALYLTRTPITDRGLRLLTHFNKLKKLSLNSTNVTDACLQYIGKLTALRELPFGGDLDNRGGFQRSELSPQSGISEFNGILCY